MACKEGKSCGRLFMPHVNEADADFAFAERFEDSVDTISGQAKYRVNAPFQMPFDKKLRRIH